MRSWYTIPNFLTLTRIVVVPIIFWLWSLHHFQLSALLAAMAALTDFFDGKLARRLGQESAIGALLDPVADKVMVVSLFGLLAYAGILSSWVLCISVIRNVSQLLSIPILIIWKKIQFKVKPLFIPKFASGLSFAIIIVGLLMTDTNFMPEKKFVFTRFFCLASILLAALDIQIVVSYWPRFFQVLNHEHDTFE